MKHHYLILILASYTLFVSCTPSIHTTIYKKLPLNNSNGKVQIFGIKEKIPPNAEKIGIVKITDSGFTLNCNFDLVSNLAKEEAKKIGGDAIKLTKHDLPDFKSSCHRITADILKLSEDSFQRDSLVQQEHSTISSQDDYVKTERISSPNENKIKRFRIGVNYGGGYSTGKLPDDIPIILKQYAENLKSGSTFSSEVSYLINNSIGFGVKYSSFNSENSLDNISITYPNGITRYGAMRDDINVRFIGGTFYNRLFSKNKNNNLLIGLSIGKLNYKNDAIVIDQLTITGNTLGFVADFGYDISITEDLALGFLLSWTQGSLSEIKINQGGGIQKIKFDANQKESLSRIDFSIGLKFHK